MKGTIDICLAEISTLHEVIEELRIVNERYKDKYMRNRIVDSKGTNQGRKKEQALHEIDAIIRKHKSSLTKMPVL